MDSDTEFSFIFERFYKRIEKDTDFFHYYNIDMAEAMDLAHEQAKGYLLEAMDWLSSIGGLQVDFSDYCEKTETIHFKITNKERKLIVGLMFQIYMERDLPLLHAFKINFAPNDLSVFSPANERNSYEAFIKRLKEDNEIALDDYKNRDRITGRLKKTINYSTFGDL